MNKIITTLLIVSAVLSAGSCRNRQNPDAEAAPVSTDSLTAAAQEQPAETTIEEMEYEPKFEIRTSKGTMIIKLASSGFYNGILFHRVINGFMIQAGDPLTKEPDRIDEWGTGGPGYTVPAEIIKGFTHKKGALAAARRGDFVNPAKASSGSQFYIVQDALSCSQLDGQYTVFGEVIKGIDVIDKIAGVDTDRYDRPLEPVEIIGVTPYKE